MREACGPAHLKAILATGDLQTYANVYAASMVAMQAGADFIKTSTGKEGVNATLPVSLVMVRALRDYRDTTAQAVGFKPAGGMRSAKDALAWQILMREETGPRLAAPGALPPRRLVDAGRHRATAGTPRHGPLRGREPPRTGLRRGRDERRSGTSGNHGLRPRPRGQPRPRAWLDRHDGGLRPFHRRRVRGEPPRHLRGDVNPATGDRLARSRRAPTTDVRRRRRRRAPAQPAGPRCPATSARGTSTPSRGTCRSMRASSRCSSRSTTASRSAKAATSTSRSSRGISTITPAGPRFWMTSFPATRPTACAGR